PVGRSPSPTTCAPSGTGRTRTCAGRCAAATPSTPGRRTRGPHRPPPAPPGGPGAAAGERGTARRTQRTSSPAWHTRAHAPALHALPPLPCAGPRGGGHLDPPAGRHVREVRAELHRAAGADRRWAARLHVPVLRGGDRAGRGRPALEAHRSAAGDRLGDHPVPHGALRALRGASRTAGREL